MHTDMCELTFETDPKTGRIAQRLKIKIPVPPNIPLIIGDCVHSLRCSLDYLVWQLVIAEGNRPKDCNQFPICTTRESFKNATVKRHRLDGVSPKAAAEIERVQPYNTTQGIESLNTLCVLQKLSNTDKHRRIPLTVASAVGWNMIADPSSSQIYGFPAPRNDGAVADTGITGVTSPDTPSKKVNMQTLLTTFIQFDEGLPTDADVRIVLASIRSSIVDDLLPRFIGFFS